MTDISEKFKKFPAATPEEWEKFGKDMRASPHSREEYGKDSRLRQRTRLPSDVQLNGRRGLRSNSGLGFVARAYENDREIGVAEAQSTEHKSEV